MMQQKPLSLSDFIRNPNAVIEDFQEMPDDDAEYIKEYGIGVCHSQFIAICVHVRNNQRIYKYMSEADTDWDSLVKARKWVFDTIRKYSNPVPDLHQPLHYVIEATSTYHMPVLRAWCGIPSVINPMLAGATKKKTDVLDAERLSFHDLTGVWPESYVPSDDIQELRILLAERNHYSKHCDTMQQSYQ